VGKLEGIKNSKDVKFLKKYRNFIIMAACGAGVGMGFNLAFHSGLFNIEGIAGGLVSVLLINLLS